MVTGFARTVFKSLSLKKGDIILCIRAACINTDSFFLYFSSDWMCPVDQCGEEVSEEDVKPDRACLKELAKLKSRCRGCKWEGDLLELEVCFPM